MPLSSKKFRLFWLLAASASVLLVTFSGIIGHQVGTRFGSIISRIGKGKISDPVAFATHRMIDSGFLLALLLLLILFYWQLWKKIANRKRALVWLPLAAFIGMNLWIWGAMQTGLFWAGLYTGKATSNFTQFEFKKTLLKENNTPHQLILVGSSQTEAELDENKINQRLQKTIWTTELHFPGSQGVDLVLVLRRLRGFPGEELVCYVSEYYFYAGFYTTTPPYFFEASDAPDLVKLGFADLLRTRPFLMGFAGNLLPVFRCREPIAHRLLGIGFETIPQTVYDDKLQSDLEARATVAVREFKLDERSNLQKAAFEEFIREAARQNRKVTLLEGQVNPILASKIAPSIRMDMKKFLRELALRYPNVVLVTEDMLPPQTPADYKDLTHVTEDVQAKFSQWFADYLQSRESKSSLPAVAAR